jgi:mannose-6-phosphate isomerase-like protein (cupin superfamily)
MKLAFVATLPLLITSAVSATAQRSGTAAAQPTTTATITVTELSGAPLSEVRVTLKGSLDRSGSTQSNGMVKFDGMRPGTFRLRFEKEGFVTFEREIEVRPKQPAPDVSVALTPAPPPPAPPPPPPAPEPAKSPGLPPPGKVTTLNVTEFLERNLITNSQPQKVSAVSCSGLGNTVLWQVREPWDGRQHPSADAMLYVVGGDGTLRLDGRDTPLQAGSFAQVPRATSYSLSRRGRSPVLIVLAVLVGEPCP